MQRKSKSADRRVERNIEVRSDGFSFRVRMKVGETFINETFFSLEEARTYRDLLRAGRATDKDQEKVLRAKVDKKKAVNLTISSLFDRYLSEVTVHKKGHKEEAYSIGRLQRIKSFATLPVYLVDGGTIDRLKFELRSSTPPLTDTTIRKYLMLVSHLFKVAITRRWCPDLQNPIENIALPRPARMRNRRFDPIEFEYLCKELSKARNPLVMPFFEFLVESACRRGEALRLRERDVDLSARTATLIDTKNGEDRIIGLSSRAVAILELLFSSAQRDNVVSIHGKNTERKVFPLTIHAIRFAFEEAKKRAITAYLADCKSVGCEPRSGFLQDLRLHDCRREATSRMFEKGLDIMEVSTMTGHKTLSMLRGYTHLRASNLAKKLG